MLENLKRLLSPDLFDLAEKTVPGLSFPPDERNCVTAVFEALKEEKTVVTNGEIRPIHEQLRYLLDNFHQAGPEHCFYCGIKLIEYAHEFFAVTPKGEDSEAD